MKKTKTGSIVIYTDENGNTELRADIEKETVWATQEQIARLFEVERSVVTKHIKNILDDNELDINSVCANFAHTAEDGKKYMVNFYNLDVVLAVGYRTNSSNAIKFRIWATRILRDYVVKGYSLDNKTLANSTEKIECLSEAISLIESNKIPGKLKGKITIKLTKDMKTQ